MPRRTIATDIGGVLGRAAFDAVLAVMCLAVAIGLAVAAFLFYAGASDEAGAASFRVPRLAPQNLPHHGSARRHARTVVRLQTDDRLFFHLAIGHAARRVTSSARRVTSSARRVTGDGRWS